MPVTLRYAVKCGNQYNNNNNNNNNYYYYYYYYYFLNSQLFSQFSKNTNYWPNTSYSLFC